MEVVGFILTPYYPCCVEIVWSAGLPSPRPCGVEVMGFIGIHLTLFPVVWGWVSSLLPPIYDGVVVMHRVLLLLLSVV